MHLVTTPLNQTWPKNESEIIFLGEWCKTYSIDKNFINNKIILDPLSDRGARKNAYEYTNKLYEELLSDLSTFLNNYHCISLPKRSWRIICGTWLKYLINNFYHKWLLIEEVKKINQPLKTICIKSYYQDNTFKDFNEFLEAIVSDEWNHYSTSLIIKSFSDIEIIEKNYKGKASTKNFQLVDTNIKKTIFNGLRLILKPFTNNNKYSLNGTYISKSELLKLSLRLKTLPNIYAYTYKDSFLEIDIDPCRSTSTIFPSSAKNEFDNFIRANLLKFIPRSYLEGFKKIKKFIEESPYEKNPDVILTTTRHCNDDVFNIYTAHQVSIGAHLKVITHGGGGKFEYSDFQNHELKISDSYFTWGWSDYDMPCYRGYMIKEKIIRNNNKNTLVLTLLDDHKYAMNLAAEPSYEQLIIDYIDSQKLFLNSLNSKILTNTIIKLGTNIENDYYENFIHERLKNSLNNSKITFMNKSSSFNDLASHSNICVSTYNATTFVETIASDIPTVIFWNPEHNELTGKASKIFELLTKTKIFHTSPISAAHHINDIWSNPNEWWDSDELKEARDSFKNYFCKHTDSISKDLVEFIRHD